MTKKWIETELAEVAYLETGGSHLPPALFVHGIPTSGHLWRRVLAGLKTTVHGYAPDLMGLGDTRVGRDVPLDMSAQADNLADLMGRLGHERFALICHDQGGAAAQLLATRHPERILCFVVTNCVCYDNWPVPAIARLQVLARVPGLMDLSSRLGLFEFMQTRIPGTAFRHGVYRSESLTDEAIREYLRPLREGPESRERFRRFLLAGHPRYSMAAVSGLRQFRRPTLILWGEEDRYLSPYWAGRLEEDIPGVERVERIPEAGHFWQEERPEPFVAHMQEFFGRHLPARNGSTSVVPRHGSATTVSSKGEAQ